MSDLIFIRAMLPAGWDCEWMPGECGYDVVIHAPNKQGYVTIDLDRRVFRPGISSHGQTINTKKYGGRGWKKSICMDAIDWLRTTLQNEMRGDHE